jgi:hypothetical protein
MENTLAIFEGHKIRRYYDEKTETWFFSVVDIIAVLTEQPEHKKAQSYWTTLKNRLKEEGSEVVTKCDQLKLEASDGKKYLTDVANPETLLRLIQSVPSPKAEPIKLWLAKVGYERIQDMSDPARSLDRAREYWQQHGRSEKWIQQRMMGQETRNKHHTLSDQEHRFLLTRRSCQTKKQLFWLGNVLCGVINIVHEQLQLLIRSRRERNSYQIALRNNACVIFF